MKDEEIIEQAWKEQGVIPDTRANLILCKAVIKITKEQIFKNIDLWIKERTYLINASQSKSGMYLIRFMPFEWEDFKKEFGEIKK